MLAMALPPPLHRAWRSAAALLFAGLVGTVGQPAWAAAGAQERRCSGGGGTIIADVPWPQQRYDLSALSQITDGSGVRVAVVDSGVDAAHPQLRRAVVAGEDRLDPVGDGRDDCIGHGTGVASVIAARPVAGTGLRGLAPGVTIVPIRVSERIQTEDGPAGAGDVDDLAAGIRAAVRARPRPAIINVSLSTTGDHPALRSAVAEALAADIVVVAAAGNRHDRGDPTPYPAGYDGVVGVGAIGADGTRADSSQVGSYVDLVAPGSAVVVALPGRGHQTVQGTSFATPFVAATAALVRARWPDLDRHQVVRRLLATADPAPGDRPSPAYGWGILNPTRALTEVMAPPRPGPTPAPIAARAPALVGSVGPGAGTVRVAAALVIAAALVAVVAAAVPQGRRRRWRPGT
jgi:type VII secretion-associated serine protease mycosin